MDSSPAPTMSSRFLAAWIWLGLGPGNMKIDHVKALINEIMAVSTLLSGFSIGMSGKITDASIRDYATFLKKEFFGKNSHFCRFDVPKDFPGSPEVYELPAWGTGSFTDSTLDINAKNPKQAYCSEDNVCWEGHWQTLHAGVNNGFDPCSLTAAEVEQLYPTYWNDIIEEKTAKVQIELGSNTMTIIMTTVTVITLGSLMRLSLVKRFDEPQAWLRRIHAVLQPETSGITLISSCDRTLTLCRLLCAAVHFRLPAPLQLLRLPAARLAHRAHPVALLRRVHHD
jgi:hypothetical protein